MDCEECVWWTKDCDEEMTCGICRRYAPRPVRTTLCDEKILVAWPTTEDYDFCGEFKAKGISKIEQQAIAESDLIKLGEADIIFRYPTGRTKRLIRQGKIRHVVLPDGEIRIHRREIDKLLTTTIKPTPTFPSTGGHDGQVIS